MPMSPSPAKSLPERAALPSARHQPSRALAAVGLPLTLLAAAAWAKLPPVPKPPDCTPCKVFPDQCKEIKRCVKSCRTTAGEAFHCLKAKRISEETYTEATGRPPDDFDDIVQATKVADTGAAPAGKGLPDHLSMDAIKKGMTNVDFSPCAMESGPGEVMVRLTINGDGKVGEASSLQNNAQSRCVVPLVKTAVFPRFSALPMKLSYPVLLSKR